MDCEELYPGFEISKSGRRGIGVVQPQSGLDYPLVAPSDDVRFLLADFYLAYDDPGFYRDVPLRQHPLRIKWLYGVGTESSSAPAWAPTPTHDADILIVDADDNVVFDSTIDNSELNTAEWQDYKIYEWFTSDGVCRLVIYTSWNCEFEIAPKNWPTHLTPDNATLDERAVYKMPRRVRSIRVVSGGVSFGKIADQGARLSAGNNMRLNVAAPVKSNLRLNTDITLTCTPGAGTGKYEDCYEDTNQPVTAINGVQANAYGDLTLTGMDCIWIRQPTSSPAGGRVSPAQLENAPTVMIGTNCGPCCDCPDYEEAALYMNRVRNRYQTIGKRSHEVKLLHEDNIMRWLDQRECRLQKPIKLILTPQNCPYVDVVIMFCNQCQACAEKVELVVDFSAYPDDATGEVVCGYTQLYAPGFMGKEYALSGTWPTFTAPLPPVDVGNSAYVKFRLKINPRTAPYSITGLLTGTNNGADITTVCEPDNPAASATDTAALNCDEDGNTIKNC